MATPPKTPRARASRDYDDELAATAASEAYDDAPIAYNDVPIVITRREVVQVLKPSEDGTMPPLMAAFHYASDYIAEHAERNGRVHLEWAIGRDRFYAGFGTDRVDGSPVNGEEIA